MASRVSRSTRPRYEDDFRDSDRRQYAREDDRRAYSSDEETIMDSRSNRTRGARQPRRYPSSDAYSYDSRPSMSQRSSYASHRSGTSSKPRAKSETREDPNRIKKIALAVGVVAVGAVWWMSRKQQELERQEREDRRRNFERQKARRRAEEERREREEEWDEERADEHESTVMSESRRIAYAPQSRGSSRAPSRSSRRIDTGTDYDDYYTERARSVGPRTEHSTAGRSRARDDSR